MAHLYRVIECFHSRWTISPRLRSGQSAHPKRYRLACSECVCYGAKMLIAAIAYVLPRGRPSDTQTERGTMSVQFRRSAHKTRSAA